MTITVQVSLASGGSPPFRIRGGRLIRAGIGVKGRIRECLKKNGGHAREVFGSRKDLSRGRVALGDCSPKAPTDPYVRALAHTVPLISDWPHGRSYEPSMRSMPVDARRRAWLFAPVTVIRLSDDEASGVVPEGESVLRRPASLRRVAADRSLSLLHRYYQDATTSRHSSRRASSSFAWRYHGCVTSSLPRDR